MEDILRSLWGVLGGILRSCPLSSQKLPLPMKITRCNAFWGNFLEVLLQNPHYLLRSCSRSPPCGAYSCSLSYLGPVPRETSLSITDFLARNTPLANYCEIPLSEIPPFAIPNGEVSTTPKVSAAPQQSEICVKFSFFHAVF